VPLKRGIMEELLAAERVYDLIFICRPATPEEEIDKLIATVEQVTAERGGKVEKVEKWGTRKLAYRINKHREGAYVLAVLHATRGDMIHELERRLKVSDAVIKYQTVRLDEQVKRQQKLTQHRDRKSARRPRRAAPAPAAHPGGEQAPAAGPAPTQS
jgi:small subunit ribosomal protein S6